MSQVLQVDNKEYIPAGQVGKHFGYTRDYILMLARAEKIDARKVGHRWYVNLPSAEKFFSHAEVEKEERKKIISAVRKAEFRDHTALALHPQKKGSRVLEVVAISLVGFIFAASGYISSSYSNQSALALESESGDSFFSWLSKAFYDFISRDQVVTISEKVSETEIRYAGGDDAESGTRQDIVSGNHATQTVHTSFVVAPGEVLTTTKIQEVRDSFSDEVSVSIDPEHPDTGIIIPHFKDTDGEEYRFLIVPITESKKQ